MYATYPCSSGGLKKHSLETSFAVSTIVSGFSNTYAVFQEVDTSDFSPCLLLYIDRFLTEIGRFRSASRFGKWPIYI